MLFKISILKNFAIFTGKNLCCNLFLIKLQAKHFSNFTGKHLCWSLFLIKLQAKHFSNFTGKHLCWSLFLIKLQAKHFSNFTGKHLCWSLFLIKLQGWWLILKRDFNTSSQCFPEKLANFLACSFKKKIQHGEYAYWRVMWILRQF